MDISESTQDFISVTENGIVLFNGPAQSLIDMLRDARDIAENLAIDLEAGLIIDDELMDYDGYVKFSNRYERK